MEIHLFMWYDISDGIGEDNQALRNLLHNFLRLLRAVKWQILSKDSHKRLQSI